MNCLHFNFTANLQGCPILKT